MSSGGGTTDSPQRARRAVILFLTLLVPSTIGCAWWSAQGHPAGLVLAMVCPGLASVLARLVTGSGVKDVSFRVRGAGTTLLLAWGLPVLIASVAYGLAWTTGLATFELPTPPFRPEGAPAAVQFAVRLLTQLTLGTVIASTLAFGEELGWRGFLLTRLVDARVPRPVLASGLIWAAWHVPLILAGSYLEGASPLRTIALFTLLVLGLNVVFAWLRFRTGSLWPGVLLHGAWNAVIQGCFDRATRGSSLWVGEAGLFTIATALALAVLVARRNWVLRRSPGDPDAVTVRGSTL